MSIQITSTYDSAALLDSRIQGDSVVLSPVPYQFNDQATGNWFAFKVEGGKGRILRFTFDTSHCDLHGFASGNRCMFSRDGASWHPITESFGERNTYDG